MKRLHVGALVGALVLPLCLVMAPDGQAAPASTSPEVTRTVQATSPEDTAGLDLPEPATAVIDESAQVASSPVDGDIAVAAVTVPTGSDVDAVYLRAVVDGQPEEWTEVELDDGSGAGADRAGTIPVVVTDAEAVEVAVLGDPTARAALEVYATSRTAADTAESLVSTTSVGHPELYAQRNPDILSRAAWQADETLVREPYRTGVVTGAMIHHTAGRNDYTEEDVPGIMRSIQTYHVKGRGWNDMGYQVLVDRFGRAWEGRGGGLTNTISGGHALGVTNYRTFGIAVMGDFNTAEPPATMLRTLERVIAWKFKLHGVNPAGTTWGSSGQDGGSPYLRAISGHRDENATDCPGHLVANKMSTIRTAVKNYMDTEFRNVQRIPTPSRRIAGADRFATAASVARLGFPTGATTVFLATGHAFADALSVGPWANALGAPLLLSGRDSVPDATRAELVRLNPARVVLVGGPNALAPAIEDEIASLLPTATVERVAGETAPLTSAAISSAGFLSAPQVYLASRDGFPDGLVGGPLAKGSSPILLVPGNGPIPDGVLDEIRRLGALQVTILGGPASVKEAVADRLRSEGLAVDRVAGATRYETAVEVARRGFGGSVDHVYLATGANYPDALVSVGLQTQGPGPLLLSQGNCLPASVIEYLKGKPGAAIVPIGGTTSLPIDEVYLPVCR